MEYKIIEDQRITGTPGEQNIFKNIIFQDCRFGSDLTGSKFFNCKFLDCSPTDELNHSEFYDCELSDFFFFSYELTKCQGFVFIRCYFSKIWFRIKDSKEFIFRDCIFSRCKVTFIRSLNLEFSKCTFLKGKITLTFKKIKENYSTITSNIFKECTISHTTPLKNTFHNNTYLDITSDNTNFDKISFGEVMPDAFSERKTNKQNYY